MDAMNFFKVIRTERAPEPVGPYSQALISGDLIFCSGQLGIDPATGQLEEGVEAQTRRSLMNLQAILEKAGSSLDRVIRCTMYLTEMRDFKSVNSVYSGFFHPDCPPTRVVVGVASLPLEGKVEVDAIAKV